MIKVAIVASWERVDMPFLADKNCVDCGLVA